MQYRPDAATLLGAVAEVLDGVLADVAPDKQHGVRVAAHLTRLVEREVTLGAAAAADERAAIAGLLGSDASDPDDAVEALVRRIRATDEPGGSDDEFDDEFDADVWRVLVGITRRDLEIAKPGHSDWTGS